MNCSWCQSPSATYRCSSCRVAIFCSLACQTQSWNHLHGLACPHLSTVFGHHGFKLDTEEEQSGFVYFIETTKNMGYNIHRGLFHTVAGLCDSILQIVYDTFPDYDLTSVDTMAWHASVQQDLVDHATDGPEIKDLLIKQLWRNLPPPIAKLFKTQGPTLRDSVHERASDVTSNTNLQRSRLSLLPHDLQLLLMHDLPAYSILAIVDNSGIDLTEDVRKSALILLMDRDYYTPMHATDILLHHSPNQKHQLERLPYSVVRQHYDTLSNEIAEMLYDRVVRPLPTDWDGFRDALFTATTNALTLEGRYFGLRFDRHLVNNKEVYMCHPMVDKRLWTKLPSELGMAIRRFSSAENQKIMHTGKGKPKSKALYNLIHLVVQKIDLGVHWLAMLNPQITWSKKYTWPVPHNPHLTYVAVPDAITIGPETHYNFIAQRMKYLPSETVYKDKPVSDLASRILYE